jgi:hypothetical protein
MSLQITTSDRRFSIKCRYKKTLIEYFNTIDKRYFEKQEWSFPVDKLKAFKEYISTKKIEFSETSAKNVAKLFATDTHIELKFSSYIQNFQDYVNIQGAEYIKGERKFKIPLDKEDSLCNMLMDHKFSILRSGESLKRKIEAPKAIAVDDDDDADVEEYDEDLENIFAHFKINLQNFKY